MQGKLLAAMVLLALLAGCHTPRFPLAKDADPKAIDGVLRIGMSKAEAFEALKVTDAMYIGGTMMTSVYSCSSARYPGLDISLQFQNADEVPQLTAWDAQPPKSPLAVFGD